MVCGVYCIENTETKEKYVGSSFKIEKRISAHFSFLRKNKHANKHLQNSFNKYGESKFTHKILLECQEKDLIKNEQLLCDSIKPNFNKRVCVNSCRGLKHTDEAKEKIRKAGIGRLHSKEAKDKMSAKSKGRIISLDQRIAIRNSLKKYYNDHKSIHCMKIIVCDTILNKDYRFNSQLEAAHFLKMSKGSISYALINKTKIQCRYTITEQSQ